MKKRCVLLCLILIAIVLSACSQNGNKTYLSQDLVVDQNRSWFDDYSISDGTVRMECHVCVLNQTSETMDVCLIGDFSEDQKSGFIKENKLIAQQEQAPGQIQFELMPGENEFDILFVGTSAGYDQKANRLLPAIEMIPINHV